MSTVRPLFAALALLVAGCATAATVRPTQAPVAEWWPADFRPFPPERLVAFQKVTAECEIADRCYTIEVVTRDGCPTSLYGEIAILDAAGTQIGYSNDTSSSLRAGDRARLTFDVFETGAKSVRVTQLSCR